MARCDGKNRERTDNKYNRYDRREETQQKKERKVMS